MKKTINKMAAYLLTAVVAATSGICVVSESADAAENEATIHITTQEIRSNREYYHGFVGNSLTQDDVITAHVGDVLEVVVYAQTKDQQLPLFVNAQTALFFNNTTCSEKEMIADDNGVLEFCDDYYDPEDHVIAKTDVPGVINPEKSVTDWGDTPEKIKKRNNVYYNFSDIKLRDLSSPTALFRLTLRVVKSGECYINTGNYLATSCIKTGEGEYDYAYYDMLGAELHTEVDIVKSNFTPQTVAGDADGDGVLTIQDATLIQRYLAEFITLSEKQKSAADMNGSGVVGIEDVTAIQMILARG